ncbi:MAG: cyclic nucleotide-binding domain-containing protein [Nitrospinaceae bacterium]
MNQSDIDWLRSAFREKNLFSRLSESEIGAVIDQMARNNFAAGDRMIQEGESGEWFFIVQQGRVSVTRKKWLFGEKEIATLGPKEFFGEMSLLSAKPRCASLYAAEDTICFSLFKRQFQKLVDRCPTFRKGMEELIAQRDS